jgi:hypothetical protein
LSLISSHAPLSERLGVLRHVSPELCAPAGSDSLVAASDPTPVFFGQWYVAVRRRVRHTQRRMPPAAGVPRLPAGGRLAR